MIYIIVYVYILVTVLTQSEYEEWNRDEKLNQLYHDVRSQGASRKSCRAAVDCDLMNLWRAVYARSPPLIGFSLYHGSENNTKN